MAAVAADVESAMQVAPLAVPPVPVEEIYPPHAVDEAPGTIDLVPTVVSVDAEPGPAVAEVASLPVPEAPMPVDSISPEGCRWPIPSSWCRR